MKLPWGRAKSASDGERAHKEATEKLAAGRAKGPEVRRVAASLRELRERNHFAEQIAHIFEGGTT